MYHSLFHFLESEGIINPDSDMHLWALHYVYLPRLNRDLADFVHQWNHHGLRTEGHMSPLQIFVQGCLQQQGRSSSAMQYIFGGTAAGLAPPHAAGLAPPHAAGLAPPAAATDEEVALLVDWQEKVTVPHIDYPLEEAVMEHIQAQFDPLSGPRGEHVNNPWPDILYRLLVIEERLAP